MKTAVFYTMAGVLVTLAIVFYLVSKIYNALKTGLITVDIKSMFRIFLSRTAPANDNFSFAVRRGRFPRAYWLTIAGFTILTITIAGLAILIFMTGMN